MDGRQQRVREADGLPVQLDRAGRDGDVHIVVGSLADDLTEEAKCRAREGRSEEERLLRIVR